MSTLEDLGEERMKNSQPRLRLLLCGHEFRDEDAGRSSVYPTCPSSKRPSQSKYVGALRNFNLGLDIVPLPKSGGTPGAISDVECRSLA